MLIISIACSNSETNEDIAYIWANSNSEYEKTFTDLNLGILFDFNFKFPKADKSWVTIWVEGYREGNPMEQFPLTKLSYGISPNEVEEGSMGLGIINPGSAPQLFIYSGGGSISTIPESMDDYLLKNLAVSTWDYAIDDSKIALSSGEEKLLAVYRMAEKSIRTYDYQDMDSINEMISEDGAVLLLKIMVEESNQ